MRILRLAPNRATNPPTTPETHKYRASLPCDVRTREVRKLANQSMEKWLPFNILEAVRVIFGLGHLDFIRILVHFRLILYFSGLGISRSGKGFSVDHAF